jgi:hypothetical protein
MAYGLPYDEQCGTQVLMARSVEACPPALQSQSQVGFFCKGAYYATDTIHHLLVSHRVQVIAGLQVQTCANCPER